MNRRWTSEKAWQWYNARPWICGFNYVPSYAVNFTEFWQPETFDAARIAQELSWAQEIGLNSCRINLQYLLWEHDDNGFFERFETFLQIASEHEISVMPCPFDDCGFSGVEPHLGFQGDPIPGVFASRFTSSPGHELVQNCDAWPRLKTYLQDILRRYAEDERILLWDLYNEPGNWAVNSAGQDGMDSGSFLDAEMLPLITEVFAWAREIEVSQPLSIGWHNEILPLQNQLVLSQSDVITFHRYADAETTKQLITDLKALGRPVLCTEWMQRDRGSLIPTHVPLFQREEVGCYMWMLINGRLGTHNYWGDAPGTPTRTPWSQDLLRTDGTPYDENEVEVLRAALRNNKAFATT